MAKINSNRKGAKGERVACNVLKEWSELEFSRVPRSGALRWKKTDNIVGDITCTEPNHICYMVFEVKLRKSISINDLIMAKKSDIMEFWSQVTEDGIRGKKVPVLMMRYDGLSPKDFFFIAIPTEFYRALKSKGVNFKEYLIYSKTLVIIPSNELIAVSYKLVNKVAKSLIQ
jgi:hypothetical protein